MGYGLCNRPTTAAVGYNFGHYRARLEFVDTGLVGSVARFQVAPVWSGEGEVGQWVAKLDEILRRGASLASGDVRGKVWERERLVDRFFRRLP